ncbi:hypothetical protein T440DRAFT_246532 [Plenodomus tracheiphilus IPT5]|uniref:Endonuclease/exonuclease/phosphatase domain-containing protein n=1 Tax=Plenodomus tracheiphilus IPT5 TaxID=1408161 RepID=A0A6A7ASY4_9PLEO|nr:hypothetical protein T440DRAFT_246532 [Plenodomus tracheiphilus IPT5]
MSTKGTSIMEALTASIQSGPARLQQDALYQPKHQTSYFFQQNNWQPVAINHRVVSDGIEASEEPNSIRLISWNIDVLVPWAEERMAAALDHLDELVSSTPTKVPVVVFLQEMGVSDITQIKASRWIRERFHITDIDEINWLSPQYGTIALVDLRLMIEKVFRVPWVSKFQRDGLFVDVAMSGMQNLGDPRKVLRLCNTHLESLVADPPVRPRQLQAASIYLHQPEVACALLAGDMNAIQPFDRTLHSDNSLKDTYIELGGQEDSIGGYTWGQQAPQWMRDKFGCSRMDKILFTGSLQPRKFERIGMGVTVDEEHMAPYRQAGEQGWVTDHYGVMGDFEMIDGWSLRCWGNGEGS